MSLSSHVHHFALVISIYDLVIFIDAGGPFKIGVDQQARADGSSTKARGKPHICVHQLPSSYAR